MIFGCDVNKPSPTDKSRNRKEAVETTESIAAVTGSIDPNYAYYAARMIAQKKAKKERLNQSVQSINQSVGVWDNAQSSRAVSSGKALVIAERCPGNFQLIKIFKFDNLYNKTYKKKTLGARLKKETLK